MPYGPLIVMGLLTDETQAMPYDDLYALATPKQPFNMLFNMSNVLRSPTGRACRAAACSSTGTATGARGSTSRSPTRRSSASGSTR